MSLKEVSDYDDLMEILGEAGMDAERASAFAEMCVDDLVAVFGVEIQADIETDENFVELTIRIPR